MRMRLGTLTLSLFLMLVLLAGSVSAVDPSLIAHYKFEDNVQDSIGNNDGVNHGAVFVEGVDGKAISLDGVDDYVEVNDDDSFDITHTNAFTISGWFKLKAGPDPNGKTQHLWSKYIWNNRDEIKEGYDALILKRRDQDAYGDKQNFVYYYVGWKDTSGQDHFEITRTYDSPKPVTANELLDSWNHLVQVVYIENGTLYNEFYVDGVLRRQETRENAASLVNSEDNLTIGEFFNGSVDEIKIWNRALSKEEIEKEFVGDREGKVYFVSPNGSDINNGTYESPWETMYHAAQILRAGDTAIFEDGTYVEKNQIKFSYSGVASAPIVLKPRNKHEAKIVLDQRPTINNKTNIGLILIKKKHITIKNFELTQPGEWDPENISPIWKNYNRSNRIISVYPMGDYVKIIGNKIHNGYEEGVKTHNIKNLLVDGNEIYDFMHEGIDFTPAHNSTIRNNLIYDIDTVGILVKMEARNVQVYNNYLLYHIGEKRMNDGIYLGGGCNADRALNLSGYIGYNLTAWNNVVKYANRGLVFMGCKDCSFYNNVVFGADYGIRARNHTIGLDEGWDWDAPVTNPTFKNNIIVSWKKNATDLTGIGDVLTHDYNLYYNSTKDPEKAPSENNRVYGDPKFVNVSNDNFRLKSESPAIDAGANVSEVTTDIDGVLRPHGSAPDIGAYEYGGVPPVQKDLVAHYKFKDNVLDSSGYENHGTRKGNPQFVEGIDGQAISLDGVDDYVDIGYNQELNWSITNANFTVSAWIKQSSTTENAVPVGQTRGGRSGWMLYQSGTNQLMFFVYNYADDHVFMGETLPLNEWVHITGVSTPTETCLYKNGVLIDCDRKGAGSYVHPSINGLWFGAYDTDGYGSPDYYFNGSIDEVKIWNYALSEDEIEEEYNGVDNENYTIENNYAKLTISRSASNPGRVESLIYKRGQGEEQINVRAPLSRIYIGGYEWGDRREPESINDVGDNKYKIRYGNSGVEVTLKITPSGDYFKFEIVSVNNPNNEDIYSIDLFILAPIHVVQDDNETEWVKQAADDDFFMHALPLNVETVCEINPGGTQNKYRCKAHKWMRFEDAAAVLITVPKIQYYTAIKNMIQENGQYNLPYPVLDDGRWFRESGTTKESYILAEVTPENYEDILGYATRGNFPQVVLIQGLQYGYYNKPNPRYYTNEQQFLNHMQEFKNAGVKIGVHSHFAGVNPGDPFWYSNISNLFMKPVGKLTDGIGTGDRTIGLTSNASEELNLRYYSRGIYYSNVLILIGDENYYEVVGCRVSSSYDLIGCSRGSNPKSFVSRTKVRIAPMAKPRFFLNDAALQTSADSFAEFANRLNISLVYADGNFRNEPGMDAYITTSYNQEHGLLPYLNELKRVSGGIPIVQTGSSVSSYEWYYVNRVASWDGVPLKAKDFTKNYKVGLMLKESNPYRPYFREMGWWLLFGSNFSDDRIDFDATTLDDIHYAMTKVIAFDTSMGLEFSSFYEQNDLVKIFDLFGLYNEFIDEEISGNVNVPDNIKEHLKQPDNEAELNHVAGYNLVEKKVHKKYLDWTENDTYTIDNLFESQKLKVEIRPKFDYYGFSHSGNVEITNFSGSGITISPRGSGVTCNISNGRVTATNNGAATGACAISIPGDFNLKKKRGIGLSITPYSNPATKELVVVSLGNSQKQSRRRDFKFLVNFTGQKTLILGDPTTDLRDIVDGEPTWYVGNYADRSWGYYWDRVGEIKIYISNIDPGLNYSLQLHSLKGLQEKGTSDLVNPTIEINGDSITFPVTLKVDNVSPHILEYDGYTRQYKIYNGSYGLLSTGSISNDDIIIGGGENIVKISSNPSSAYSTRADVRISVYDDEDGDGIPTNGSYSTEYPCNGTNNFCDDNCPGVPNPAQRDSDSNGIGDACEHLTCRITNAYWSKTRAEEDETVTLIAIGDDACNGMTATFTINKQGDTVLSMILAFFGIQTADVVDIVQATFVGDKAEAIWTAEWQGTCTDGQCTSPVYDFDVSV